MRRPVSPHVFTRDFFRRWIRRRQEPDRGTAILHKGRIYILPTRLGLAFAVMVVAMLLGSLNYANNLGLALTFLLAALGLVTMHACHRNLAGLRVGSAGTEPPFAGQDAGFLLGLSNPSAVARFDIEATHDTAALQSVTVPPRDDAQLRLMLPTRRRGRVRLERCEIATRYPFGLFRAWAVLHTPADCLVYPKPATHAPEAPPTPGAEGSGERRGEDDFAGLKDYHPGDPPRRIAWKAYARGGGLLVKEFSGAAAPQFMFDLDSAAGADLEARLAVLTRWVVDAHATGHAFGLRLPGAEFEPRPGDTQRARCLAALADFSLPGDRDG